MRFLASTWVLSETLSTFKGLMSWAIFFQVSLVALVIITMKFIVSLLTNSKKKILMWNLLGKNSLLPTWQKISGQKFFLGFIAHLAVQSNGWEPFMTCHFALSLGAILFLKPWIECCSLDDITLFTQWPNGQLHYSLGASLWCFSTCIDAPSFKKYPAKVTDIRSLQRILMLNGYHEMEEHGTNHPHQEGSPEKGND